MKGMKRAQKSAVLAVALLTGVCVSSGVATAGNDWGAAKPGSDGAGDSYYPQDGNGGYDVADYNLKITYDPASRELTGNQDISARATQSLSSFNLDLHGLTVDAVQVDGRSAKFDRSGDHELTITPSRSLRRGANFHVKIGYHGVPTPINDPTLGINGWQYAKDGGVFVVGAPKSATTWYPVNDTPLDKATFHLAVTVPDEWRVIGNGRERGTFKVPGGSTHIWAEETPAAPYVTTVAIGKWTIDRQTRKDGTPIVNAFAPGTPDSTKQAEARLPEILDFLETKFGKYPIDAAGGIFLNEPIEYSLETIGRPTYAAGLLNPVSVMVHVNSNQWYGNSVTVDRWRDVCINECVATYATWLWKEAKEAADLNKQYADEVTKATPEFWNGKLYDMGPGNELTGVYTKGPVMLHALRNYIGQTAFDRLLKTWPSLHRDGHASMQDFQRYAEFVGHKNLKGFFDAWVYGTGKPADKYLFPGALKPAA
jgi:aminopeptidase N